MRKTIALFTSVILVALVTSMCGAALVLSRLDVIKLRADYIQAWTLTDGVQIDYMKTPYITVQGSDTTPYPTAGHIAGTDTDYYVNIYGTYGLRFDQGPAKANMTLYGSTASIGTYGSPTFTVNGNTVGAQHLVINDSSFSIQSGADTACDTTCSGHGACLMGFDTVPLACNDASADYCLCGGP